MKSSKNTDNIPIEFRYKFKFNNGTKKEFNIKLDRTTLNLICKKKNEYPKWTELIYFKCLNCPLDENQIKYCPVVINLFDIIDFFKNSISYEEVYVTIESEDRKYAKQTSLQEGLNSLVGIYMVTSGCPILEKLKPLVRVHLPFSTIEETSFRIISMYLLAQYFVKRTGGEPDWELKKLVDNYNDIRIVNKNFCNKLSDIKIEDATINALVTLDCFAFSISHVIDENKLDRMRILFDAYLK